MGFPTKNDHFGVFGGYHPFKETPIYYHVLLGGGFKDFLFSPPPGGMIQFD